MSEPVLHVESDGLWLGDRRFAWAEVTREDVLVGLIGPDDELVGISAPDYRVRHAAIPFENGLTVSLSWGTFSHSPNGVSHVAEPGDPWTETPDAVEVAVMWGDPEDPESGFVRLLGERDEEEPWEDDVLGWTSIPEVVDLIDAVQSWPSSTRKHAWP
jgi:hypothetical protein